jgi:hypothetical protein
MFDEIEDLGFGSLCFNKIDPSPFWNNVLVGKKLTEAQIDKASERLVKLDRKPAFFYENSLELAPLTSSLIEKGYAKSAEDSLMFHDGLQVSKDHFEQVRKVTSYEDLETFMRVFDQCYRADDPLNPYGELGEYIFTAKIAWEKHHANDRIEYFIAFKGDEPVAVASLTNYEGIGYLSNIGSLLNVRGQGFGKLITNFCVDKSVANGNHTHCLATEEGTNPNSFYQSLGFITRFTAVLMVKS